MASLLLATATATTTTTKTSTYSSSSYSTNLSTFTSRSLFAKPLKSLITEKRYHRFQVSCKTKDGDQNPTNNGETFQGKFDRRNVLLGLGGLYGAANLVSDPFAVAAPVQAPEVTKCDFPSDLPPGAVLINNTCCPPKAEKIVDYKLPRSQPKRVRPAAHLVSKEYIAKFSKAIELMKALPEDDPRNFTQQANVHCAYCNGAYEQVGFPDLELQIHNSWLFFPFHRWYLYFYERILGKLIGDPTFALPFWNWDTPAGMTMPALLVDPNSSLYDQYRNAGHLPPTIIDLGYNGKDTDTTDIQKVINNLTIMYRQMITNSTTPILFLGSPYRAGDKPSPGAGSIESTPHIPVHRWVGDPTQKNGEDMGNFYSAGRDTMFYSHHANIDRMWTLWRTLGGKRRTDFTDPDWLNTSFLFYDEDAQAVRVTVKDCCENTKLGYVYQPVPIPWLKNKPVPRVKKSQIAKTVEPTTLSTFPVTLNNIAKFLVKRPKKSRSSKEKEDEEEILVIEGIELEKDKYVKFDVFVNDEDETEIGLDKTEYAGSFAHLPHKHKGNMKVKTDLRLGLSELLEDLEAEDDDAVLVTLVPKFGGDNVTVAGAKIECSA
ncbi:unnamed protein product [Ilex paraguariensis]|uniref:Tyrosinase copper-binding domain-containing protein n=1 Tax=Ilex paraguariensis TaxID=185542 RepID=A0ABC8S4A7_9AQUA